MLPFAMADLEHFLCNKATISKPQQATKHWPVYLPGLCIVLDTMVNNIPMAVISRGPARGTATAGDPEVDVTNNALSRVMDSSTGPPVT